MSEGARVETETVENLIGQVRKGEILLPEFQRGYVWNTDQVRALVRSMYRGHPTGHLLIWRTYRPGKIRGETRDSDGYSRLLLDGQQRLTSLYTLFEGAAPPFYEGESLFFDLYFNARTEEFRFWQSTIMKDEPTWISVAQFLGDGGVAAVLRRIGSMTDSDRELFSDGDVLERLGQLDQLRNYRYTLDTLQGDDLDVEEVVQIFNRVNSAGTPLKKHDLALAHVCSVWPEARREMRKFTDEMEAAGFGVDLAFLIRCVAGVASDSVLLEGGFYKVGISDLQLAWKKTRAAFEHLVNVLRHEAYVDRIADLGSPYVLMPLTVFLARNDAAFDSQQQKQGFLRWMYLASIWTRYSGSTETKLQKDISRLDDPDPVAQLLAAIAQDRGRLHLEAKDLEGKGAGTSVYKMSYIVARARGAQDWFTGETLYRQSVGKAAGLESHHIFPRAVLRKALKGRGYTDLEQRKMINELANRAFLTQKANRKISSSPAAEYLPDVEERVPGALRAQCVPMNRELWEVEQFEAFLIRRQQLLALALNEFVDSWVPDKAEPASVRDSEVPSLLARGESANLEFKSTLRWDVAQRQVNKGLEKVIAKTVAGFLNSQGGGTLLIGVADDGSVYGLEADYRVIRGGDRDGFENHLTQTLARSLGESALAFVNASFHTIDGLDVCRIAVEPSDHPIYVFEANESRFYLRTGNSTRALPPHEFAKYVAHRWGSL